MLISAMKGRVQTLGGDLSATKRILNERLSAARRNLLQSTRTVRVRTREHDTDQTWTEVVRSGIEEDIDARPAVTDRAFD